MAQPVWITNYGNLGTVAEGQFFQLPIQAIDPDNGNVYYNLLAGSLPAGVQCHNTGVIQGTPKNITTVQGVPAEVSQDVTSTFAIRAFTVKMVGGVEVPDRINDRTFSITVAGQDLPEFITPAGLLDMAYDGTIFKYQILTTNPNSADTVEVALKAGELPPGLSIDLAGKITGYIEPVADLGSGAIAGFDTTGKDNYPYDFTTRSISKNYQFTLGINNGKENNLRTFEIYVFSKNSMTGDNSAMSGDIDQVINNHTYITADIVPTRVPFLLTTEQDLGRIRHNNWFAYQFTGLDLDGDGVEYLWSANSGYSLPPGLTIDSATGWVTGTIPDQGTQEINYSFAIQVRKQDNPDYISRPYEFSMTIIGNVETEVVWLTPADLGTIANGAVSTFKIQAVNVGGAELTYRLKPGRYPYVGGAKTRLPQGLALLPTGEISGRVSFNSFTIDHNSTTFDKKLQTNLLVAETTFDRQNKFTVEAYNTDISALGHISVFKDFSITLDIQYNEPYESLYIKALPPVNDRMFINRLLDDVSVIPNSAVYRIDDPYFGKADSVIYEHAFGLSASSLVDYVEAMKHNHYFKNLTLGDIQTAQALDSAGNVIYEVVYSTVVDDLDRVSQSINLKYPGHFNGTEIDTIYPNSLNNMRTQIINTIGQVTPGLPLWMTSKQIDGKVLGFVRAWVIAYMNPGMSNEVAYYLQQKYNGQLNLIDLTVDRYELDMRYSRFWVPAIDIPGDTVDNTTVDVDSAEIFSDTVPRPAGWEHSTGLTTFDRASSYETHFDSGSTRFISPVDMYGKGDDYDKYLVFPKRTILG